MCELSEMSRARFYRHWQESVPKQADTALRDAVQRVAVEKRFYGYRRVQRELADEITVSAPNERVDLDALKRPRLGGKEPSDDDYRV